ncbi:unnamed protein product [Oppiella nova]|uniref:BPTI/Kunitz inhibitor domain-containing protein n=1 Tax=Oppiella nova TaxID=334625 RepID=A0A7R9LI88_9ACAR|nr:unnamed protein product [Oppiella nova]CAG2163878.1 unnamed protein product [Oppiella nova]
MEAPDTSNRPQIGGWYDDLSAYARQSIQTCGEALIGALSPSIWGSGSGDDRGIKVNPTYRAGTYARQSIQACGEALIGGIFATYILCETVCQVTYEGCHAPAPRPVICMVALDTSACDKNRPQIGGWYDDLNCQMDPDASFCRAYIEAYFCNTTSRACEPFVYGGCGANNNHFDGVDLCLQYCGGVCDS